MQKFKGTQGPWFNDDDSWSDGEHSIISCEARDGMVHIAMISGGGSESGYDEEFAAEQRANANLIAAAPELLEALQEIVDIVKKNNYPQPDKPASNYARVEFAESIINKALGEKK